MTEKVYISGINKIQLKHLIECTLKELGFYSINAFKLINGTIAHESQYARYIKQVRGPALGIVQMEPPTHDDIVESYLHFKPELAMKVLEITGSNGFNSSQLEYNLKYAIAFCRLHYLRVPYPIPSDIMDIAKYWKEHYNTYKGKGTVEQFINHYKKYVL